MLWNKEVFNKMLDFLEDTLYDILANEVSLQKDIKNVNNRITIANNEIKETFMEFTEAIHSIKVLRAFEYDAYNDEQDITIKKNY